MKKTTLLFAALAAGAALADEPVDWCRRWQETRCPPIPYRSTVENPQVAALINAAQAVPAAVYGFVADGVDRNYAKNEGRRIYIGVQNDIAAGATEGSILAAMPPQDRRAYNEYVRLVVNTDYNSLRARLAQLGKDLVTAAEGLARILPQARSQFSASGANALQMASMLKPVNRDLAAIKAQIADAQAGIKYWLDLVDQDQKAQEHMKGAVK